MTDQRTVHTLIRNPLIAVEVVIELVAIDIEIPPEKITPNPVPPTIDKPFKRIEYIREILQSGEILVADAEAYFYGSEGLPDMAGDIYVYFDHPKMLGKRIVDEDATSSVSPRMRLRRVYPPLELGPIPIK